MSVTRRDFLAAGLVSAASGVIVPPILAKGVFAAGIDGIHNNRVLVVLQLAGGNDGLNTVVPYADPAYATARPTVGVRPGERAAHRQQCRPQPRAEGRQVAVRLRAGGHRPGRRLRQADLLALREPLRLGVRRPGARADRRLARQAARRPARLAGPPARRLRAGRGEHTAGAARRPRPRSASSSRSQAYTVRGGAGPRGDGARPVPQHAGHLRRALRPGAQHRGVRHEDARRRRRARTSRRCSTSPRAQRPRPTASARRCSSPPR